MTRYPALEIDLFGELVKVLSVCVVVSILIVSFYVMNPHIIARTDYVGFLTGARIIVSDFRRQIYNRELQRVFQQDAVSLRGGDFLMTFRNPPTLALFFSPFSLFSLVTGYRIFSVMNIALLALAVKLLQENFNFKSKNLLNLIAFTFVPSISAIFVGQITIIILVLFLFIFKCLRGGKFFEAGILTSFLFNKPQYLFFVPFALVLSGNRKNFLKGFMVGFLFFLLASFVLVGVNFFHYPSFVLSTELPEYSTVPTWLITLSSLFYYLKFSPSTGFILNTVIYLIVFLFFLKKIKIVSYEALLSSSLLFSLPFAMHAWDHDLVLLLMPMTFLLKNKIEQHKIFLITLFFILFFIFFIRLIIYPFVISLILIFVGVSFLFEFKLKM